MITESELIEEVARLTAVTQNLAEENSRLRGALQSCGEEIRLLRALEQACRGYLDTCSGKDWCALHQSLEQLNRCRKGTIR